MMQKNFKMTETLGDGYSSESTRRGPSDEYQHDVFQKSLHELLTYSLDDQSQFFSSSKRIVKG